MTFTDLSHIPLSLILEKIKNFCCLEKEEFEWLWAQRNSPVIISRWMPEESSCEKNNFANIISDSKPVVFQDYYALYPIGAGASGIVYKAWQVNTPNTVALKRRWADSSDISNYSKTRFLRELSLWQKLDHPHILPLITGGIQNNELFLVTPYIEGGSLEQRLFNLPMQRTTKDVAPLFDVVLQIAEALAYSHSQNTLHRDVKPGNILINRHHAYLMDFGLAREINTIGNTVNITRGAVGTPLYMAPEIWELHPVLQSDLYSLCVIIYEIVSGTYPFTAPNPEDIYLKQLSARSPKPPPSLFPLPPGFNEFLLKGLQKNYQYRYSSMEEFIEKLKKIIKLF